MCMYVCARARAGARVCVYVCVCVVFVITRILTVISFSQSVDVMRLAALGVDLPLNCLVETHLAPEYYTNKSRCLSESTRHSCADRASVPASIGSSAETGSRFPTQPTVSSL